MNTNLRHSAQETGARPGFRLCFASPSAGGSRSFSEFLVGAIVVSVKKESWFWQQKGRAERECGAKKLAAKLGRMLATGGQRAALTTIAVCTPCSDWAEAGRLQNQGTCREQATILFNGGACASRRRAGVCLRRGKRPPEIAF